MAGQHVQLDDGRVRWKRILIDAEARWVGKVMGELAMHLEDVAAAIVTDDRYLSL
jgi:hypothetical protein